MKCTHCGKENPDKNIFCSYCGERCDGNADEGVGGINAPLPDDETANPETEPLAQEQEVAVEGVPARKMPKRYIVFAVLAIVVIGGIIFSVFWFSPTRRFARSLGGNNYQQAEQIYKTSILGDGEKMKTAEAVVLSAIEQVKTSYAKGECTDTEALDRLQGIVPMAGNGAAITEATTWIEDLKDSRDAYEEARGYQENKDYPQALAAYARVIEADENYAEAQAQILVLAEEYEGTVLDEAGALAASGDPSGAIAHINKALGALPGSQSLKDALAQYKAELSEKETGELFTSVDALLAEQKYEEAISLLESYVLTNENTPEISDKMANVKEDMEAYVLQQAAELASQKEYEAAVEIIKSAQVVLPDSDNLENAVNEYSLYLPVDILGMEISSSQQGNPWKPITPEGVKDHTGTLYTEGYTFSPSIYTGTWARYYLGGEYTTLRGTITLLEGSDGPAWIYINDAGESKKLFESEAVTATKMPVSFEVDITGVEFLSIGYNCNGFTLWSPSIILTDFVVLR